MVGPLARRPPSLETATDAGELCARGRSFLIGTVTVKELLPNNLRLVSLVLPFLLVGCAGQTRFVQPPDFPLHATDHPFFDLHWRLERQEGAVLAVGLLEAARVSGIADVTLELQGLDKDGRVVSHGRGHTYGGGPLFLGQTQPFYVRLRPTGQEVRFALKVWSFDWYTGGTETLLR